MTKLTGDISKVNNHRALSSLRNRHLWYLTLLVLVTAMFVCLDFILEFTGLSDIGWDAIGVPHILHWLPHFLTVLYAAYIFGVRGVVTVTVIMMSFCISDSLFLSPDLDHLFADMSFITLAGAVGALVAFLRNQREQIRRAYTAAIESRKALQESEERHRGLVNNIKLGIFRSTPGPSGRFLTVNPAVTEITGYSEAELLQINVSDLYVHPEEREAILKGIALATGKTTRELNFRKKDGAEIMVSDTKVAVRDSNGQVLYFDGILEDITERKQAEEALRESRRRFRDLANLLPQSVWEIDEEGTFTYVNRQGFQSHGHTPEEISEPLNTIQVFIPEDRDRMLENTRRVLSGEELGGIEYTALRKDGSAFPVIVYAAPITRDDKIVGLRGVTVDITERKQAEGKLRQAAAEWETTFDSITDLVSIHDKDFRLVKVNKAFADTFKVNPKELIGKTCYEIVHGTKEPCSQCPVKRMLRTGKQHTEEYFEPQLGIHLEVSASPIVDEKGEVTGLVHQAKDITKRKQAEEKEKQLQQELNLSSRLASIGEMASGVAHEINNPLTGVIGFSQLLLNKDIPDDIRDNLQVINSEAQRVAKIVAGLLTFARQRQPGREYLDINDILSGVLELRSYEMKVNNIEVETQLTPNLPKTMADAGQLQQVFLNIVLNAEKEMIAAHNRGKLSVTTKELGDIIRVSITDDGPGISRENLDRVFDPFFTTKEVGNGTGLGLSICHGIITQHNGKIYARSELGKGATFIVELPIVADTEKMEPSTVAEEEPWQQSGARILVVDDEKAILDFLKRLLTEEGYQVETTNRAQAALKRLQSEPYDVMLLDIKMPGMSGIDLYYRIKAIDPALTQRVIFITGDVMETATRDFLDKTKAPYIAKPLNIEQLKQEINQILVSELELQPA